MATPELTRSTLLRKDRDELVTIAEAMGARPGARTRKAQVVDMILALAGVGEPDDGPGEKAAADRLEDDADDDGGDDSGGDDDGADHNGADDPGSDREDDPADRGDSDDDDDANRDYSSTDRTAERDNGGAGEEDEDGANRRRRRRRGRDREADQLDTEPIEVEGHLDLRDDGYGFLRVDRAQPNKRDVYVSVKQVRQNGLRKGDHLAGQARPASRNEKNPALVGLDSVNGAPPAEARDRPRFEDLTPVSPTEKLQLERADDVTSRVLDLLAPIGKGQRGLLISPPRCGKTALLASIARSILTNHPECRLLVVLIDERPEEVTDFERGVDGGEVMASTFDRSPEEHILVADMAIERAKRLVEAGDDVVVLVDGLTRLARAHNLAASGNGRTLAGGIDAAAVHAPKRLFGAARNIEGGGSLAVIATAQSGTSSRLDEAVLDELAGTANMELRLDRSLAERRVFPAIDLENTSTRRDDLLVDEATLGQLRQVRDLLRRSSGVETLLDLLADHRTNAELLSTLGAP